MHPAAGADVHAGAPIRERTQASAFDAILEQSRNLICEYLDEAIAGMLDKADETLFARMNETRNREECRILEEAREMVAKERDLIESGFRMRYLAEFRQRCDRARKIAPTFETSDISHDALELVGEDDLDETLKFNDMAGKLRTYCDDELAALDQRVGVLLGDATLQANDNPFSPQVICDAYKHACRQLEVELGVRRVLLQLFDDHVLDAIRAVYKDVNTLLVQNSILPKIRYGIARELARKPTPSAAPGPMEKPVEAAPAVDMATIAAQDLFSILQKLASSQAGATGGTFAGGTASGDASARLFAGGAVPPLQGAELLGSLTRIQRGDLSAITSGTFNAAGNPGTANVLRELKATSVGAGMGQLDLLTLDIIAMLFDQLFDDPKVPNGVKGLIGRLQIPMLKVAIADKSFFSSKSHPARRLLDAVGDMASRLPADFGTSHPLFERLQDILQELVDGFQDDLGIFAKVCEQLSALMAEEDRRIEEAARAEAKRVEEMENLALAKSAAQEEIRRRVQEHVLPMPIVEFLAQQWLKLLLLVHAKEGKDGAPWKGALQLMDQLIWSIAPKHTPEERARLGTVMPKLIKNLTTGMRFIGTEDSARERFFAELMKCHTHAIGAPPPADPTPPAQANAAETANAAIRRRAAAAAARHAVDRSLDFSKSVTVKNPYGSGDVSVDSQDLDFTEEETASRARARREESIRRALDTLGMGTWVEFREPDDPSVRRPARLIFVSPRKSRYLFAAGPAGKDIIQCSRAEIGRRLRIGEAVKLDKPPQESLFDRIMGALLGKLRGPMRLPLPTA